MDAVGSGIDAVRAVRHRDVTGEFRTRVPVENGHAADRLELALLHCLLDALQIEDDDPVLLLRHHFGESHTLLRVVAGRPGVFALVVRVDIVEIAVDLDLPGDLHGLAIDGRED